MAVTVRLVGDLRKFAGSDTIELEGGGCTLGAAFDELARHHPRLGGELFDEQGRLHYALVMLIDGRPAAWPEDRDKLIEDGGDVLLTRFHSGG
mgnify:CR=1 FL=1